MVGDRGALAVESLLKIILVLVVAWLALEVLDALIDATFGLLGGLFALLRPLLGVVVLALIVLWLLDRV